MVAFVVNIAIGIIELLLALRFLFRLFGASSASSFISWLYSVTNFFLQPFAYILPNIGSGRFVFELSTVAALVIYGLIGWLLTKWLNQS